MRCRHCGRANPGGGRFCEDCGNPLALTCPSCGGRIDPGRRFCGGCGARLAPALEPSLPATFALSDQGSSRRTELTALLWVRAAMGGQAGSGQALKALRGLAHVAGVPWGGAFAPPGTSPHDAFALDVDLAAFFQHERILEARVDVLRHLNLAIGARRFHSRRCVHRIAPNRRRLFACRRRRPQRGRCPAHADRHVASMRILGVSRSLLHAEGELASALSPATTGQPER